MKLMAERGSIGPVTRKPFPLAVPLLTPMKRGTSGSLWS